MDEEFDKDNVCGIVVDMVVGRALFSSFLQ